MKHVYCICYLDTKYYKYIDSDLKEKGFKHMKAIIPTVKILRYNRNKPTHVEVPILFNYGFIRMSSKDAYSRDTLNKVKKAIQGIKGWVKSPESLHPKKKKARIDNMEIFDDFSKVALATKAEVRYLKKLSRENKRFSVDNLNIKIGEYLVLKGYPYDGINATVLAVNHNTQMVKLLLYPENGKMELNLPFDSVIYSVYENYEIDNLIHRPKKDLQDGKFGKDKVRRVLEIRQY